MSYKSVLGQQTIKTVDYYFSGRTVAETLQTVFTAELAGTYIFTCSFEITGQGPNEDSDMRAGNVKLFEFPNVSAFSRTLSGIAQTGTFHVKQQYRDACDYAVHLKLTKLV